VQASGNAVLAEMHETLQARIKRLRSCRQQRALEWARAVAEHEEMIAALEKARREPAGGGGRPASRRDRRSESKT
jgi:DNA-binding GntR family transcriptional regulator